MTRGWMVEERRNGNWTELNMDEIIRILFDIYICIEIAHYDLSHLQTSSYVLCLLWSHAHPTRWWMKIGAEFSKYWLSMVPSSYGTLSPPSLCTPSHIKWTLSQYRNYSPRDPTIHPPSNVITTFSLTLNVLINHHHSTPDQLQRGGCGGTYD